MKVEKYHEVREKLIEDAFEVSNKKGQDYTQKSDDALKNFKSVAERTGMTSKQVLGVYMMKHLDAISSFIEHDGQLESEPIKERIIDAINYLCLLWGLIQEDEVGDLTEERRKEIQDEWNEGGFKEYKKVFKEPWADAEKVDPVEENGNRISEDEALTFTGAKKIRTNFGTLIVHTPYEQPSEGSEDEEEV